MALVYGDRVKETSTTTGTGTYDLAGAVTGFTSFVSGIGTTNTCYYTATNGIDWEVGLGTVTDATPDTLARTTILASSNAGSAVNWSAGTRDIFCTIPGINAGTPPGSILAYGAAAAPFGFLLCDGSAVSRTTYAILFSIISTNYGVGDGSTTFNVPDMRSRIPVGYGTGTISETQPAANWDVSDIITVDSNTQGGKPKWQTGMAVVVTTTDVLPTGISAATTYYVRRLSATTISLYDSFAHAININDNASPVVTGLVNITATGSGNHTLTHTLQTRALNDRFGHEVTGDVPAHTHQSMDPTGTSDGLSTTATTADKGPSAEVGDTSGISNMPPATVVNYIIKF